MNGLYQVSNLGRIKSLNYNNTKSTKIIRSHSIKGGYLQIQLRHKGQKNYLIHRLVAEAFVENPDNLPEVNHKDENKLNNEASNLEWCTSKYNSNYGTRKVRWQEKMTNHPKLSKSILCIETGIIFPSLHEAERQTRNQG